MHYKKGVVKEILNIMIEYLRKMETKFEHTSACLSGAWICEKYRGKKSHDTLPLKYFLWAGMLLLHPPAWLEDPGR